MNIIIKTLTNDRFSVSEEEFEFIANANKDQHIRFPERGIMVKKANIGISFPEDKAKEIEQQKEQKFGVLHDGTKVQKMFGQWKSCSNPDATINVSHYPEIALNKVMSEEDYNNKQSIKKYENK